MGFFSRKEDKKENNQEQNKSIPDTFLDIEKQIEKASQEIKDKGDETMQIMYMSEKPEGDEKNRKSLMMVGNPIKIIRMLASAGVKEEQFGAIIIAAADKISRGNPSLKSLKDSLLNVSDEVICNCPDCVQERNLNGNIPGFEGIQSLEDLGKMSKGDIDKIVNELGKKAKGKR